MALLTDLTKKDQFKWIEATKSSFQHMKKVMTSNLVQAFLDFSQPFIIEREASSFGIGVSLMENQWTIDFNSGKMINK